MADAADTSRPSQLWKQLTTDRKLVVAEAFWRDENAAAEQAEVLATIAQRIKFRMKSVMAMPVDKKVRQLVSLPAVSEAVAARLLVAYHLAHQRPDDGPISGWAGDRPRRRNDLGRIGRGRHAAHDGAPRRRGRDARSVRFQPKTCRSISRR